MEQKCKNCKHYYLHNNQQSLCYYGDVLNVFMFGPKRTTPNDICANFVAQQSQNSRKKTKKGN